MFAKVRGEKRKATALPHLYLEARGIQAVVVFGVSRPILTTVYVSGGSPSEGQTTVCIPTLRPALRALICILPNPYQQSVTVRVCESGLVRESFLLLKSSYLGNRRNELTHTCPPFQGKLRLTRLQVHSSSLRLNRFAQNFFSYTDRLIPVPARRDV